MTTPLKIDTPHARRLYEDGHSLDDISRMFGCSHQTIKNRLAADGVKIRSKGSPKGENRRKAPSVIKRRLPRAQEVRKMRGMKPAVIAHELGITVNEVNAILGRNDHLGAGYRLLSS